VRPVATADICELADAGWLFLGQALRGAGSRRLALILGTQSEQSPASSRWLLDR
jgi:hypothetical protein